MTASSSSLHQPPDWTAGLTLGPLCDSMGVVIIDWDPDRLVARMPVEGNQ